MTWDFPPNTYRVSQLGREIEAMLDEVFPFVWVGGEVQRPRRVRAGHFYFELVEKGANDRVSAKLDAALFRGDALRVERKLRRAGVSLEEGQTLRMLGELNFYPPHGRLQFLVRDIDVVSAVGALAQRRQETMAWLRENDLLGRNASLELDAVPLRVGLVTSEGSAAHRDFMAVLEASGYGFEVTFAHASVQGGAAEAEVAAAVHALSSLAGSLDAIAVIRGGGAKSDLAAFDGRDLATAIARSQLPVLTGLGHEIDRTIADEVAYADCTTPTAVAELLVQRVAASDQRCAELSQRLVRQAERSLDGARSALDIARQSLRRAELPLQREAHRLQGFEDSLRRETLALVGRRREALESVGRSLAAPSQRSLERSAAQCDDLERSLGREGRRKIDLGKERLSAFERMFSQLDPQRTLERGFSITRDAEGRAVRDAASLESGDRLTTEVATGRIVSRVEDA
ncbi:MAG: exodeoxyribonuclease VII large subunit [Acidobacteriota bacterium]